jgi:predicted aspartyl protease/tetratricopeptide (TPR) repeat protein
MSLRIFGNSCRSPLGKLVRSAFVPLSVLLLILPVFAAADLAGVTMAGTPLNESSKNDVDNTIPQTEAEWMKQGEKAFRRENFDLAETDFRKVLEMNKTNVRAKLRLSHTLYKKHDLVEAYYLSYEVAKEDKTNAYAFALVGNVLLAMGNFTDAKPVLTAAINLDSGNAFAGFGLGMLDFYENRLDLSQRKLGWAAFKEPDEPDFILAYAQVSARLERFQDAAEAYRTFLRIASNTDADRRARIRGLVDFLEFLGTKSALYDVDGADSSQVPIELVNDRPIVTVRTGKKGEEFRFVLDTGSNITVVSQRTADRLHLRPVARGGTARGVGGDGKFDIVYGFLPQISIGDVRVKNVPVYMRAFPEGVSKYDGYIGLAVISKFLTTIDFGNMTLTMERAKSITADVAAVDPQSDEVRSNLRLTPSGFLSGEVNVPGVDLPLNFIVDTGAELSVISTELAERDIVKTYVREQKMRVIGAAGVTEGVPLFNLPSISVGKHSIEDVRAIALNLNVINENSGFEQSGILGGNFLKHYRLKFDFQRYTLSFIPITPGTVTKE